MGITISIAFAMLPPAIGQCFFSRISWWTICYVVGVRRRATLDDHDMSLSPALVGKALGSAPEPGGHSCEDK